MKLKKMLAAMLTMAMVATALPVTAFAEDDPADPTDAVAYIAHDVKEYVHGAGNSQDRSSVCTG